MAPGCRGADRSSTTSARRRRARSTRAGRGCRDPRVGDVPVVDHVVVIEDHRRRHDRQEPALDRRAPRLVVQPAELVEVVDQLARQTLDRRPFATLGDTFPRSRATSRRRRSGRRGTTPGPATRGAGAASSPARAHEGRRHRGHADRSPATACREARGEPPSGTTRTARVARRRRAFGSSSAGRDRRAAASTPCHRAPPRRESPGRASAPRRSPTRSDGHERRTCAPCARAPRPSPAASVSTQIVAEVAVDMADHRTEDQLRHASRNGTRGTSRDGIERRHISQPSASSSVTRPSKVAVIAGIVTRGEVPEVGLLQMEPDLIEALVRAGRVGAAAAVAESLTELENRTGRPWQLAVAARCRGCSSARIPRGRASTSSSKRSTTTPALPRPSLWHARTCASPNDCSSRMPITTPRITSRSWPNSSPCSGARLWTDWAWARLRSVTGERPTSQHGLTREEQVAQRLPPARDQARTDLAVLAGQRSSRPRWAERIRPCLAAELHQRAPAEPLPPPPVAPSTPSAPPGGVPGCRAAPGRAG